MDLISIAGLIVGLTGILLGQVLEGGHINSLLQFTAFLIVIGGTAGAVMLQSPWRVFKRSLKLAVWVVRPPVLDQRALIEQIVAWSGVARREGLLALESRLAAQSDPYIQKGLQLLVDGMEPERIREVLDVENMTWESEHKLAAKVWESAGGYAPTIGIIGAVLGLIHVMENLSDPSKLGAGIAVAFVATIYGVGSANLVFLPVAKKILTIVNELAVVREMLLDGFLGIAHGDNPRLIENRLEGYLLQR